MISPHVLNAKNLEFSKNDLEAIGKTMNEEDRAKAQWKFIKEKFEKEVLKFNATQNNNVTFDCGVDDHKNLTLTDSYYCNRCNIQYFPMNVYNDYQGRDNVRPVSIVNN